METYDCDRCFDRRSASAAGSALSGGSLSGGIGGSLSSAGISLGNPKTGDTSAAAAWITLVAACSVCAVAFFV